MIDGGKKNALTIARNHLLLLCVTGAERFGESVLKLPFFALLTLVGGAVLLPAGASWPALLPPPEQIS